MVGPNPKCNIEHTFAEEEDERLYDESSSAVTGAGRLPATLHASRAQHAHAAEAWQLVPGYTGEPSVLDYPPPNKAPVFQIFPKQGYLQCSDQ